MARRLSGSFGGQSLQSRKDESKGARKKELGKIERADKKDYADAPQYVKNEIRERYKDRKRKEEREWNKGKFI
jgi:hypothetical protein